jgi:organic radical activating enzyme
MLSGYIAEIFSSYQGEGGCIPGSCFGKRQIFVRFSGCNIGLGSMGTKGCVWCDTPKAKLPHGEICVVKGYKNIKNPVSVDTVEKIVHKLTTKDLHSISFTGGEPLLQIKFLKNLAERLAEKYPLFLETNGSLPGNACSIKDLFAYVSCDIKDRSAYASKDWLKLVKLELETIRIFKEGGSNVYAKLVVSKNTLPKDIHYIGKQLSLLNVPISVQIVSNRELMPKLNQIFKITEIFSEYLSPKNITISCQAHKLWAFP